MSALQTSPFWPFAVLLLGIAAVVTMISIFRFHPFVALILSAILVGLVSINLPGGEGQHPLVTAVELPMIEFGSVAGKIAWVIALAAIIGTAMMESGAAERIVNWLLAVFGVNRAAIALMISGFVLSIPVFFDTVFFLLIPLAITLGVKTGKNYVFYVLAIAGGAAITHTMVPPTPGPLIMAETLKIDLGITIMAGLLAGILPAIAIIYVAKYLNNKLDIPIRVANTENSDGKSEAEMPSLLLSLLPVVIPVILISMASIVEVVTGKLPGWIAFAGNKNVAMFLGTALALWLWAKQKNLNRLQLWEASGKSLEIAGIIILITSAGGAFGAMIKHSGIGNAIEVATEDFQINYIILAWIIAAVMKTAQGSSTVAMITTSSIMVALIGDGADLAYHPIYILMGIGFGSGFISWMNDSGFWVVAKMSGFKEKEALQTWTLVLATMAVVGLVEILLMSWIIPLK